MCLGKPFQPERKLACDIQNKAKAPAMISKLDRSCNWDNKNRPAIATRINSLSSLLLEDIGSPTKQWFADNLRLLPLQPTGHPHFLLSSKKDDGRLEHVQPAGYVPAPTKFTSFPLREREQFLSDGRLHRRERCGDIFKAFALGVDAEEPSHENPKNHHLGS